MTMSDENSEHPLNLLAEQSADEDAYAAQSSSGGRDGSYQSEAQLERIFINDLKTQGYDYLPLPQTAQEIETLLLDNLRDKIERLNAAKLLANRLVAKFTDKEWDKLLCTHLLNPNDKFIARARKLRNDDDRISFTLETGSTINISLLAPNPNENSYQVISQVKNDSGKAKNRYDVSILVNGLPLVHIELKRKDISIVEAFKQINRYRRDSFWASGVKSSSTDVNLVGLYSWAQIFIGSNGNFTRYWSNTVKELSRKDQDGLTETRTKTPGYEFTSAWANKDNEPIHNLHDFTQTFLDRRRLGKMLHDYCIMSVDDIMRVLRPYQVYAVEESLSRFRMKNPNLLGTTAAGGYIWHTTGSGKTLASFVLARIMKREMDDGNSKVFFVVDRQDLDTQTKKEFNQFAKNSVDGNKTTRELKKQLLDPTQKIIVTTIQKLSTLAKQAKKNKALAKELEQVRQTEMSIVYDECHRSQFGISHTLIKWLFPKNRVFGFTGTPIFEANAQSGARIEHKKGEVVLATTEALFGKCLHSYTIVNAIDDKNVLPFKIDYRKVGGDDKESLESYDRALAVVRNIFASHNTATRRRKFNAIMAVESVKMANVYYQAFKQVNDEQQALIDQALTENDKARVNKPLRVATVYTYGANQEYEDAGDWESLSEEDIDNVDAMLPSDREALLSAMSDYNKQYGTSFTLGEFASYKDDVARRMKSHRANGEDKPFEIDLLIVVNMFLTGFDAMTLNTLYVDKNLRMHGLIQAFSRTNRILNSIKSHGEIICYRDLRDNVDEALKLFGQKNEGSIVILPGYDECLEGVKKAIKEVQAIGSFDEVLKLKRESEKVQFVKAWTRYLRALNMIVTFSRYESESIGEAKLSDRDVQDYSSAYNEFHRVHVGVGADGGYEDEDGDTEPVVYDITLLSIIEVNVDYILNLIGDLDVDSPEAREKLIEDIERHIGASANLRNKRKLIMSFVNTYLDDPQMNSGGENIYSLFTAFAQDRAKERAEELADKHHLINGKLLELMARLLTGKEFYLQGQDDVGLKRADYRIGFGKKMTDWKAAVRDDLHEFYDEYVDILLTID